MAQVYNRKLSSQELHRVLSDSIGTTKMFTLFNLGYVNLEERALAEQLFIVFAVEPFTFRHSKSISQKVRFLATTYGQ